MSLSTEKQNPKGCLLHGFLRTTSSLHKIPDNNKHYSRLPFSPHRAYLARGSVARSLVGTLSVVVVGPGFVRCVRPSDFKWASAVRAVPALRGLLAVLCIRKPSKILRVSLDVDLYIAVGEIAQTMMHDTHGARLGQEAFGGRYQITLLVGGEMLRVANQEPRM